MYTPLTLSVTWRSLRDRLVKPFEGMLYVRNHTKNLSCPVDGVVLRGLRTKMSTRKLLSQRVRLYTYLEGPPKHSFSRGPGSGSLGLSHPDSPGRLKIKSVRGSSITTTEGTCGEPHYDKILENRTSPYTPPDASLTFGLTSWHTRSRCPVNLLIKFFKVLNY